MKASLRFLTWLFWTTVASLISLLLLILLARLFYVLYPEMSVYTFIVWINRNIGFPLAYYLAGVPILLLFALYFYRRSVRRHEKKYLELLIEEVHKIEEGSVRKIPVENVGQLGQLATDINRMVERLRTSMEEERRAEQTKNELITNVSHDLRTPLTSITGYLGLIDQDRYRDEVELRYYVNMAYEESLRLKQLLQDLFEFTRLQNKEMKLQKTRINLAEMLDQIIAHFGWQLQESGMECRLYLQGRHLYVHADGDKLRRVYENLITNAIRYGHEGKYIDIRGWMEGEEAVTEVANYGDPIPESDLPHLFDRFYRVEKSRASHTGGSGIGLAIAKHIVDLHQGTIAADSNEYRTVFTVRLPQNSESFKKNEEIS
ncbi:HAMP domain-containing sensor histidine kinase [Paenibacillus macerans]|uniref:histidine kinase n=1 Tax=Paenibacillus macerans TaxID=44252 RepID=A0A6N8ESY5_PAEMA|nr:HAMP domain-containing sensor histidine kinase [Paenibacillus macerans]MBS5913291.1 HAMP domain-containing histidine kinase [Paenibacillus macerans]MEC0139942.1 HAMP domain-containing sensor histidine kinase [Paenibacillus macerans]MUG21672.1 two-component sensor histidine kinase [Paenibacillus macerans]OMG46092.1 two-component sensor histidine kinase [Paenibacillus macerans]UMV46296.1 HAMP domain-containing histidine kinase [Paenibacillus macerans]